MMDEERKDGIVYRAQVAHVTFSIKMHEISKDIDPWYEVFSESGKEGRREIDTRIYSYDFALRLVEDEIRTLEEILERKRAGMPTPKQLHFLFREKIPIPLTLTWGKASDIIEERLAQIAIEKEAKRKASELPFHKGDKIAHPSFGIGTVSRAGTDFASVQFPGEEKERLLNIGDICLVDP